MEKWKAITGYEGLYEVSDQGRVRSVDRVDNIKHFHPGKFLSIRPRPNGYICAHLSKEGVAKWYSVHRLVAEAFVEKPIGCNIVNHLDNNPANNAACNLEWTTYKGYMQWATKQGRMHYKPENLRKAQESQKRPVIAIDKEGNRYSFSSQREATDKLGLSEAQRGHIAACCRKDYGYQTVAGYSWQYG